MTNILYIIQSNQITVLWAVIVIESLVLMYFLFFKNRTKSSGKSDELYIKIKELINYSISPRFTELSPQTKDIVDLAVEIWRIEQRFEKLLLKVSDNQKIGFESSLRKLKGYLNKYDIEVVDYTGKTYNDGLNLEILSVEKQPKFQSLLIKETIEPTVLLKGQVIKIAKIILQQK